MLNSSKCGDERFSGCFRQPDSQHPHGDDTAHGIGRGFAPDLPSGGLREFDMSAQIDGVVFRRTPHRDVIEVVAEHLGPGIQDGHPWRHRIDKNLAGPV